MFSRILTVCIGNVCRSPMAEALLAERLRRRGVAVESAGIAALIGHPPIPSPRPSWRSAATTSPAAGHAS